MTNSVTLCQISSIQAKRTKAYIRQF